MGHRASLVIVLASLLVASMTGFASASPGQLDDSFDGDGKVTTDFTNKPDSASDVAVQANGRILVVGFTGGNGGKFDLARYRSS
ncbi:MAG TPA: calcium-binding protein, partial [Actinomycetota bacterium]